MPYRQVQSLLLALACILLVCFAQARSRQKRHASRMSRGSYDRDAIGSSVLNWTPELESYGKQYHVDPLLLAAVVRVESDGNPSAVSSTGAVGLMQLTPAVCHDFGVSNPYEPKQNIRAGAALMAKNMSRFKGDLTKAIAAYNAGPGNVVNGAWQHLSETVHYVPRVLGFYRKLKAANATS